MYRTIMGKLVLTISGLILLNFILSCVGYIPNQARKRWGMREKEQKSQLKNEATVAFDNIPYLVSWEKKYTSFPYDTLGGVRSIQGTYDRLRYEMARKFANLAGENSDAWKRYNNLMMSDIVKDSSKIEIIYEKTFGSYAPAFDEINLVDQALYSLAERIKNNRWIYPNPYVTNMLRYNDLLNLTLAHLECPEIKELGHGQIYVEFPGRFGEYLMEVNSTTRSSKNINNRKNCYLNSKYEDEKAFGERLATYNVSIYSGEVFRQYFNWNKTVDIRREDSLQAQILNVMVPMVDSGSQLTVNKVGVEVNYYFPLNKVGVKNDSLSGKLECVVTNMKTSEEVIYGMKKFNKSVKGLPVEGVYNMKLFIPEIHTIDTLKKKGLKSQYKISSRITTQVGKHVENSFFELPNDNFNPPIWDMQRLIQKQENEKESFYSLEKIIKQGDSLIFEVPITGAYPFVNKAGNTLFSSALHIYWEPDIKKNKNGKDSVIIGKIQLLNWVTQDTLASSTLNDKHKYMRGEGEIANIISVRTSPNYFTIIKFLVPSNLELGKGNLLAIALSYDYNKTKTEKVICEAIWRGILKEK
ncbi:MAG TPA: hypothetical protein ENH23_07350 [candidate division Zixibacteria bacterium]|nr:hypothetical protein [candidate division Zixibacteria bacterium]